MMLIAVGCFSHRAKRIIRGLVQKNFCAFETLLLSIYIIEKQEERKRRRPAVLFLIYGFSTTGFSFELTPDSRYR
jgi:hypothetical protein